MENDLTRAVSFDFIRYANCWEDPLLLLNAADLKHRVCLSIASGGDNSFSLLTADPEKVVAFDLNPVQLALVQLKIAAFRELSHPEFLAFLGFAPCDDRLLCYRRLRSRLPDSAARYFDAMPSLLRRGVIHTGKFERYFQLFRKYLLPLAHSRRDVECLLASKPAEARRKYYRERWDNLRFRLLYRLFFNRFVMGRLGRDPRFFRYVDGAAISQRLKKQTSYAMTELPTDENCFMRYILTSSFGKTLPHYARPENFESIRARLDRLELFQGTPQDAARRFRLPFDFFNLSDIFEYMDDVTSAQTASVLRSMASDNALFAYYNMLVPRRLPALLPGHFRCREDLSQRLFAANRAFFYSAFFIDEAIS